MTRLHHMDEDRRREIRERLASALEDDPGVSFAYLYGSFVEPLPFRDVDVAVWVRPELLAGRSPMDYELDLGARLQRLLRVLLDVRVVNAAPLSFLYHVLRGRLVLCRDEAVLAEVVERTASRYLDIAPLLRQATVESFAA